MKIFNLPRQTGKTTRMLYASEYHNAPILCANQATKHYVAEMARQSQINIPKPITIDDIVNHKIKSQGCKGIMVDDIERVLQSILVQYGVDILGATITIEN